MTSNTIKSFSVYGLFGTNNVHIDFEENIKILIGENGLGKTQVLNLFYYTLTGDFFRLNDFSFDKLVLKLANEEPIEITKQNIANLFEETFKNPLAKDIIDDIGFAQFETLRNKFLSLKGDWSLFERYLISTNRKSRNYSVHKLFRFFEEASQPNLFDSTLNSSNLKFQKFKAKISKSLDKTDIMYFPTFRRVEQDLYNLGYNENELDINQEDNLIQFGMHDVQKRFNTIQNTIDKFLKEGLAQFTKDILSVVIEAPEQMESVFDKITENDMEIILSRVGDLLPTTQKKAVKEIVSQKQFKNHLSAYLLQKLIDIYEKQKGLDNAVKVFRDVCNKYLIDKKVFYDESGIKIFIKSDLTGDEILLKNLSSGEKQIISIFSKIYLSEETKKFIILFDEPELSLSMLWQRQLLPDIVKSKKCDFMLVVTHSPFIFENELDKYAVGLNEYITTPTVLS